MAQIELEVKINQRLDVKFDGSELIEAINQLPEVERWNYLGQILNELELQTDNLTKEQKDLVKSFLTKKLSLFEKV